MNESGDRRRGGRASSAVASAKAEASPVAAETACSLCGRRSTRADLREAGWLAPRVLDRIARAHPRWRRADGACPACVQEALLDMLLHEGRDGLEGRVQEVWPLDAEAAFGAIPTPLRMRAHPRFTGRGVAIALVDAAFYPHPDLVRPDNRVRVWVDATAAEPHVRTFARDDVPAWPEPPPGERGGQWHGLMTSATAAGNGWMSHGLYRGMAPDSDVVLVQVSAGGAIADESIARGLAWLRAHARELGLGVVSLSVGGNAPVGIGHPIDEEVAALTSAGVVVVAAAGNDGVRRLAPPATAADAVTVGGIDDHNVLDASAWELWHSNYGSTLGATPKPEVVAPSLWTAAPILPSDAVAIEARRLFAQRAQRFSTDVEREIAARRLITPHYQHVEGTSFAAPIVAGIVACMREANPRLTPQRVKELLMLSAMRVPSAPDERQGAGVVDAGLAVAAALADEHPSGAARFGMPLVSADSVTFEMRDSRAQSVAVLGSWTEWRAPGAEARQTAPGVWRATIPRPRPGRYAYKYLLDSTTWMPDPANPVRTIDAGGNVNSVFEI